MRLRRALGTACALLLSSAWPANAASVVVGTWSTGWRWYSCGAESGGTWHCDYYFDTVTDAAGEACVEVSAAVDGETQQRLYCHGVLTRARVEVQWRARAGNAKAGCLSSSWTDGEFAYQSSFPGMTHNAIPVTVDVRDGVVRVAGNYGVDGPVPRRYLVDATMRAGCMPNTWGSGDGVVTGAVEIDV